MSQKRIVLLGIAILVIAVVSLKGCGSYSEVNRLTYEHAKALYAACNSKKDDRLEKCSAMIAEAESAQEISGKEAGYLREIVSVAQDGQWEDAQAMARQLMTDQADR